ncbi:MAG: hydrogenase [Phycisphaerae bacterium]|nr:hydrogenase [Phycisphaerae bacterium]
MPVSNSISFYNCQSIDVKQIPVVHINKFRDSVIEAVASGQRIASLFAAPSGSDMFCLYAVLADDNSGKLSVLSSEVSDKYSSLTPDCTQAHLFEREIAEQWAITPQGHPWLKPIRFHASYIKGRDAWGRKNGEQIVPSVMDFFKVEGEQIHEVAVGPVHAGVIEPGHFRFQCHGENVLNLEISLGFQHRGIERALIGGPDKKTLYYMQTVAGDTTIGHTTAYCHLIESLSGSRVPSGVQSLRGIALELERLANHTGDLGALAGDIGYLPTSSFCGRIRGDFLNLTALICGNRFGRGLVSPGGVGFDISPRISDILAEKLTRLKKDVEVAAKLLWSTPSVLARFEDTGVVPPQTCRELGLVGVPARACGAEIDCRFNFPAGIYSFAQIPVSSWHTGDVFARAYVRWLEIQRSIAFILDQIKTCPQVQIKTNIKLPAPDKFCVSLVEGWRGEICHVGITDSNGSLYHYKITDPSFHNWTGLAMAMGNQQISDFPLCNKSFNLSYCGHDL